MNEINHFAISAILQSEIVGISQFGHGQISSVQDGQCYFDMLIANEPTSIQHKNEAVDVTIVVKAFLAVRDAKGDRGSADLYVADPERNRLFLAKCRELGLASSDYRINKALFYARKNNYLHDLNSRKTSVNYGHYAFACEFAATELRYRTGATIDDIVCDPGLASEYDSIARKITPRLSSFEYRWAILSIRKAGRHQALPDDYEMPPFTRGFRLVADPLGRIPDDRGIYLLYERQKLLYVRSTDHLRSGVELHRHPATMGAIAEKLWQPKPENLTVDYASLAEKKTLVQAIEKKIVEERHPLFNVPRSGPE